MGSWPARRSRFKSVPRVVRTGVQSRTQHESTAPNSRLRLAASSPSFPVLSPPSLVVSSSAARCEDGEALGPARGQPRRHEPGVLPPRQTALGSATSSRPLADALTRRWSRQCLLQFMWGLGVPEGAAQFCDV
jgi:hypothetical protein